MFYKVKSKEFGGKLKNIRRSFNYTQSYVSKYTKVSIDGLRRIENGYVTPRIETIIILSRLYKQDLIQTLMEYSREPHLLTSYNELQIFIDAENTEGITNLSKKITNLLSENIANEVVLIEEIQQFILFCEASVHYINNTPKELELSKSKILRGLELSFDNLSFETLDKYMFNIFETRMLTLLALIEQRLGKHEIAITIIKILIDKALENIKSKDAIKSLNALYFNLSYSYYEIGLHNESLSYANKGIDFSIKHSRLNEMHLLYYRKGIAECFLGIETHLDSLKKSVMLLEVMNNPLAEVYKNITLEKYGIDIK